MDQVQNYDRAGRAKIALGKPEAQSGALTTTGGTAIITAPSKDRYVIKKLTFTNTGSTARVIEVEFEPSGGTARYIAPSGLTLQPGDSFWTQDIILSPNDRIEASQDTGTDVEWYASMEVWEA